jgi:AcrR family transcriptional regulator
MSAALPTYTPGIRRRMRADQRRMQLLEAARRVIADGGLAGLTMESLAISAGVSRALVYQHFADRESLLLALLEAEWEWLDERIVPALASTHDLTERAAAVIRPYFDAKSERGPVFVVAASRHSGRERRHARLFETDDEVLGARGAREIRPG